MNESQDNASTNGPPNSLLPIPAQTATVLRAVDSLSRAFWLSIFGTLIAAFLVGLASIETGDPRAAIELGEYAIPKSMLPPTSLGFALFAIWLTSNRLHVMERILEDPHFTHEEVVPLLDSSAPLFDIFSDDNYRPWALSSGLSILLLVWGLYFGMGALLAYTAAVERGATAFEFEWSVLAIYLPMMGLVLWYGGRALLPPVSRIMAALHGRELNLGWPRTILFYAILIAPVTAQNLQLLDLPDSEFDDFLGPAEAHVIDGESLFISGVVVKLFGIDAPEPEQVCYQRDGKPWPCGASARGALQNLIADQNILCNPIFSTGDRAVVAVCGLLPEGTPVPTEQEFYDAEVPGGLASALVRGGHVVAVGIGANVYDEEQREAQGAKRALWAGAFEPPWVWRARQRD